MRKHLILSLVTLPLVLLGVAAVPAVRAQQPAIDPGVVDATIKAMFKNASPEWQARIDPDEAQRLCSQGR